MGMNSDLDRDIANYRSLTQEHQTRVRAGALRRAHALRHAAFREVFDALARGARQLGGVLFTWCRLRLA